MDSLGGHLRNVDDIAGNSVDMTGWQGVNQYQKALSAFLLRLKMLPMRAM